MGGMQSRDIKMFISCSMEDMFTEIREEFVRRFSIISLCSSVRVPGCIWSVWEVLDFLQQKRVRMFEKNNSEPVAKRTRRVFV